MKEHVELTGAPEGWLQLHSDDPFNQTNGPFYVKDGFAGDNIEPARIGFRVNSQNCSFAGICHGGVIASALDIALGHSAQTCTGARHTPTISLNVDFLAAASEGEWLESRVRIIRKTRRLVFADSLLVGQKGSVARATGVFKIPAEV
jgi:uncharacterized protein (TIGR00369 family)